MRVTFAGVPESLCESRPKLSGSLREFIGGTSQSVAETISGDWELICAASLDTLQTLAGSLFARLQVNSAACHPNWAALRGVSGALCAVVAPPETATTTLGSVQEFISQWQEFAFETHGVICGASASVGGSLRSRWTLICGSTLSVAAKLIPASSKSSARWHSLICGLSASFAGVFGGTPCR